MRSATSRSLIVLLAVLLLWRTPEGTPSVVIVTIDTLRADFVEEMPELRRFLEGATHFAGARTVAPITLPAHVSLMSGLYPAAHGIHDNITPPLPRDRGFSMLAEEFRDAGYATAAFVASAVLAPATGMAEGFEAYDTPAQEATGEERLPAVVAWLHARDKARPFFLWMHLYDPHAPYRSGAGGRDSYREEVLRADAALGRLLSELPPETIVVVASDHGEGLGDHGEATHGPLCFGSVIDAVLAVRAPGMDGGVVDRSPRSLVDIAPSLRHWCGLPARASDGARLDRRCPGGSVVLTESLYVWRMHGWGQCYSATDGRFSLVESGAALALYDRHADPREEHALEPAEHEAGERLERALTSYRTRKRARASTPGDEIMGDASSAYGMTRRPGSAYLSRRDNSKLIDPRERFVYWELLSSTSRLIALGGENRDPMLLSRALGMLEALAEQDPQDPSPHAYRAHAMKILASLKGVGARRSWREASAATRAAIERGYRTAPLLKDAIDLSMRSGDLAEMRATLALAASTGIPLDADGARALAALRAAIEPAPVEWSLRKG